MIINYNSNLLEKSATDLIDTKQEKKKIVLKEKRANHLVDISNIIYLSCDCYLTSVITINKEVIVISKLLKEFEELLHDYGFVRVSRNTIINSKYVKRIESGHHRKVYLNSGDCIHISRRGLGRLKKELML